jgi:hypothetical protein
VCFSSSLGHGKDKDGRQNDGRRTRGAMRSEQWAATRSGPWPGARAALGAGRFLHGPQARLLQLGPISRSTGLHYS